MPSETISKNTLQYLRLRLENRSLAISHQKFPVLFNEDNRVCVTKDTIYIQVPERIASYPILKMYAFQIHESFHILYSSLDFKRMEEVIIANGLNHEKAKDLLNIIEDYRVNVLGSHSHAGAGRLMNSVHRLIVHKHGKFTSAYHSLLPVLEGHEVKLDLTPKEKKLLAEAVKLIKPVAKSLDLSASLDVLPKAYKLFFDEYGTPKSKQDDTPYEIPEDVDLFTGKQSGVREKKMAVKKALELMEAEENKSEEEKEADEKKAEGEAEEIKKEVEKTVEHSIKLQVVSNKKLEADKKEIEKGVEGPDADGKSPNPNCEQLYPKGVGGNIGISYHHSFIPEIGETAKYHNEVNFNAPLIHDIQREIRKALIFARRWANKKPSGRLDSRRVHKILVNGESNVFRTKTAREVGDTAILLLVDNSGSMSGPAGPKAEGWSKIDYARDCSIILHEVLTSLKITHMIVGYTADHDSEWARCQGAVSQMVYKTWNQVGKATNLVKMEALSNNCDGGSIRAGITYFKNRGERRKVMIIISDGYPQCGYYNEKDDVDEEPFGNVDTIKAQKEAVRSGIKVINIGIGAGYHFPDGYLNKVKVDNVEELPGKFCKLLRRELAE